MSEFHVNLTRDAFDRYTKYLVRKLSDPIRDFYGVVLESVQEEYERESKRGRKPTSSEMREMLVAYCREFALLNTDQIAKTIKVMLKRVPDVGTLHSILKVLFRNEK